MRTILLLLMLVLNPLMAEHTFDVLFEPHHSYALNRNDQLSYKTNFSTFEAWYFHFGLGLAPFFDLRAGGINAPLTQIGATYLLIRLPYHKLASSLFAGLQFGQTRFQMPFILEASYHFRNRDLGDSPNREWFKYVFFVPKLKLSHNLIRVGPNKDSVYSENKSFVSLSTEFEFSVLEHYFFGHQASHQFGINTELGGGHIRRRMPANVQVVSSGFDRETMLNMGLQYFYRFAVEKSFYLKLGFASEYELREALRLFPYNEPFFSGVLLHASYTL